MKQLTLFGLPLAPDPREVVGRVVRSLDSDQFTRSQVIKKCCLEHITAGEAAALLDKMAAENLITYIGPRKFVRPLQRRKIK